MGKYRELLAEIAAMTESDWEELFLLYPELHERYRKLFASPAKVGAALLPKYTEWMHLRTHGQWSDGVPAWARDHSGRMNDLAAALAVISELYDALTSPAKVGGDEREAFESYLRSIWTQGYGCAKDEEGCYRDGNAQSLWECWHAALSAEAAKLGGDERELLSRAIDCLEILDKRPSPLCRDCADNFGTCPHTGLACDMAALIKKSRAALSADGGEDKRDAERYRWLREEDNDELVLQRGPVDKSYVYLPRLAKLDEMIDAAIAANQAKGDA